MSHFIHRLEVRFRDCDPMGHANNAVYLTYLEQARFAHWRSLWGFGTPQLPPGLPGVILARVECDYRRPTKYGDTLEIRLTVAEIGRTSFRYAIRDRRRTGTDRADGEDRPGHVRLQG